MLQRSEGLVLLGNEYNRQDPAARAIDTRAKNTPLAYLKKKIIQPHKKSKGLIFKLASPGIAREQKVINAQIQLL